MDSRELDDIVALLPPLLQGLDRLAIVARHFDPGRFGELMAAVGDPADALAAERRRLEAWPDELASARTAFTVASDAVLSAFNELQAAPEQEDGLMAVFRALRHLPRAEAALYPLARGLPPVSRFFLEPARRDDEALLRRLAEAPEREITGIMHGGGEPGARGGFSLYVPEYYDDRVAWPVVFALHGGSGNGGAFLWSWLREARSRGVILVAPTAIDRTWALQGQDTDTPNLLRILDLVRRHWNVDETRLLLGGMSDGGTFSYVAGLEAASPFTHLAPTAAAFHPMLASYADRERLDGLPIHITHGALDWMFAVDMAREARSALETAGAAVTYIEIPDLAHTYPREVNGAILSWLGAP